MTQRTARAELSIRAARLPWATDADSQWQALTAGLVGASGRAQNCTTDDDGGKFTELYNADKVTGAGMVSSSAVVISIQRFNAALGGEAVPAVEDAAMDSFVQDRPVEVQYCPELPPEAFDLIIVDECHRSIYGVCGE